MSRTKLSSRDALLKVLRDTENRPTSVKDLVDAALPLCALKGKTPRATLSHVLYVNPLFVKTSKGKFKLSAAGVEKAQQIGTRSRSTPSTRTRQPEPVAV